MKNAKSNEIAKLNYLLTDIQTTNKMNIQTDKEIYKIINQLTQNQDKIIHQIHLLYIESPTNCLNEHAKLYKNYVELLTLNKDLLVELKTLKYKK